MVNEKIISKGVYGFSQINNFIAVKNYIFFNKDDKTCLALRLSNETEFTFDSVEFSVIQIDAGGNVIGKSEVEYSGMAFEPGALYSSENAILVDSRCVDFKVQFKKAYSGYYKYVVKNRKVIIYYDRKKAESAKFTHDSLAQSADVSVRKKAYGRAGISVFAAVLAILLAFGFYVGYMYSLYADTFKDKDDKKAQTVLAENSVQRESLCFGVEYAET
jgi:hypothetical protein